MEENESLSKTNSGEPCAEHQKQQETRQSEYLLWYHILIFIWYTYPQNNKSLAQSLGVVLFLYSLDWGAQT